MEVSEHLALIDTDGMTYRPNKAPAEMLQWIAERKAREAVEEARREDERLWNQLPGMLRNIFGRPSADWDPAQGIPTDHVLAAGVPFILREMSTLPVPIVRFAMDRGGAVYNAVRVMFHLQHGQSFGIMVSELRGQNPATVLNLVRDKALAATLPLQRLRPSLIAGLAKLRADRTEGVSLKRRRPRPTGPDAHCHHLRDRLNPPEVDNEPATVNLRELL